MPPDMSSTASVALQRQRGSKKVVAQRLCGPVVPGTLKHKTVSFGAQSSEGIPPGVLSPNISAATTILQEAAEMKENASYMKAVAAMVIEILKTIEEMTALSAVSSGASDSRLDVGDQFRDLESSLRSAAEALLLRCPRTTGCQTQIASHSRAVRVTVDTRNLRIKKAFAHFSMGVDLVNSELRVVKNRLLQNITATRTLCSHVQLGGHHEQAKNLQNLGLFAGRFNKWKELTEYPATPKLCTNINTLYDWAQGFRFLADLYRTMKDSNEAKSSTPKHKVPSSTKLPERDSPNNPFLADLPSSPIKRRTSAPRDEKPTITYVFRGRKQELLNPYHGASAITYTDPELPAFRPCRLFKDELQIQAAQLASKPVASKSAGASSRGLCNLNDEKDFTALPSFGLAEVFEKVAAAMARPMKPLPARKRELVQA